MWLLWIIGIILLFVEPLVGVIACGFLGVIHVVSANRKMTERRENDVLAASMLEKGEVVELGQKLAKETVGNPLNLSPEVKETIVQRLQERNEEVQNMEKTAEEWAVRNKQMLAELGDRQKTSIKDYEQRIADLTRALEAARQQSDASAIDSIETELAIFELHKEGEQMSLQMQEDSDRFFKQSQAKGMKTYEDMRAFELACLARHERELADWRTHRYCAKNVFEKVERGNYSREIFASAQELLRRADVSVASAEEGLRDQKDMMIGDD